MSQEHYTPEMRSDDFEAVSRALRALSNAWVRDRVPTHAEAVLMVSDANIALGRLSVAAGVPVPEWPPPGLT